MILAMTYRLSLLCLVVPLGLATGQTPAVQPKPGDAAADRYLKRVADQLQLRFLDGATTAREWEDKLPRLRQEYLEMLGLWPVPERTPLKSVVTGTVNQGDIVIEKVHFQSMPGLYVTGNLYRPAMVKEKAPAILYVCGHSNQGRDGNKTAYQLHGLGFARMGYVCLVIDTLQLGEVAGKHHGTYNLGRWWWHSLAYTPAGVECWNGIRALDYLESRKDVDARRLGVTGRSGGGAATVWIAAADERVKVAVPASGMSDLRSYVGDRIINGHCDCMFLVNLHRWEWTTIAALIAPRPLLFANSDADPIFPMDGNRRIAQRLRQLYDMHGKGSLFEEFVSSGGHVDSPELRVAAFRFFQKHLGGAIEQVKDVEQKPLPGKDLRVFPEDHDLPGDSRNARIDESFVSAGKPALPEKDDITEWKDALLGRLREGPLRGLESTKPAQLKKTESTGERLVEGKKWQRAILESEPGIEVTVWRVPGAEARTLLILDDSEDEAKFPAWMGEHLRTGDAMVLEPRGTGGSRWTRKNPPNTIERSFALLGETADLARVRDILATLRAPGGDKKIKYRLVGRGRAGILAAYAALVDPDIGEVVAIDPPASHREGPHFLGVLRILDIPDALGLLAPRKLTLINASHPAFDRTADVYRLAGAMASFHRPLPARIDPNGVDGTLTIKTPEEATRLLPGARCSFDNAALEIRGRMMRVSGSGKVTLRLPAGGGRPERDIVLDEKQREDLTVVRRALRDRAESFPPTQVADPVVENGSLVIIGGGGLPPGMIEQFVELAGGKDANIVVLPTAVPRPTPRDGITNLMRLAGAKKVTVLAGIAPGEVESAEYRKAMSEATGIWFGGGRQWHFVDAYENTRLLPLMHEVLKRGGVIGGSSAGATIQGEYLCRGGVFQNFEIASEGYERGFAFLPGTAIDQHFAQRKRFQDMTSLMKQYPQFLGIGLDEGTGIIVRSNVAQVIGKGQVHFYDSRKPAKNGQRDHDSLDAGMRYDLQSRKVITEKKERS
ncbi:MAG: Type 1 glutamine amidotransferase-like domain-containing protein [Gemmataceae bacterium]